MPIVSVIVPVYNAKKFLRRCVDSLLTQTLEDIEIILVNDASPDQSIKIMLEYQEKYPEKIIVIDSKENLRQGGARNLGLAKASGDYIGFVDSDDWVSPEMFEALYKKAIEDQSDMVGCQYAIAEDLDKFRLNPNIYTEKLLQLNQRDLSKKQKERLLFEIGGIWSHLYKRSVILENHIYFLEKTAYEDNHFVRLYSLYIHRYSFIDKSYYFYFQNMNSTVNQKNQSYQFDRLEVERIKIRDYKQRNLFHLYRDGIEIDFVQTFYINTLALIFNAFEHPPIEKIAGLRAELELLFPDYKKNVYFHEVISRNDRIKMFLAALSPRLLILPYKIKNMYKGR